MLLILTALARTRRTCSEYFYLLFNADCFAQRRTHQQFPLLASWGCKHTVCLSNKKKGALLKEAVALARPNCPSRKTRRSTAAVFRRRSPPAIARQQSAKRKHACPLAETARESARAFSRRERMIKNWPAYREHILSIENTFYRERSIRTWPALWD